MALAAAPALAMRMDKKNARDACYNVVMAAHPGIDGKARGAEIKKCKADPDAYNKASGLGM